MHICIYEICGRSAGGGNGIVVVQVSYRLNIFGFLATAQLSQEQGGVSGNYGIQDQIMALQWVQKNIRNFSKKEFYSLIFYRAYTIYDHIFT